MLGDGTSTVTIAWLAIRTAPAGSLGLFAGLAIAAYTLPGILGALALPGELTLTLEISPPPRQRVDRHAEGEAE